MKKIYHYDNEIILTIDELIKNIKLQCNSNTKYTMCSERLRDAKKWITKKEE
jgi:hypothetical protein